MKKKSPFLLTAFILLIASGFSQSPAISGAWQYADGANQSVIIFQDGYFTQTEYSANEFIKSRGGPYSIRNNQLKVSVEFNSSNSEEVGKQPVFTFSLKNDLLEIYLEANPVKYSNLDNSKAPLAGVWKINSREQDGKLVTIHQYGARKTLKVLTGTRFQWFAINPETKEFSGTGGGTYTFDNGKYTENILFFSRDNSRVGAHLAFDGKIENGQWHHSGLSSKGEKIYEIWGRINSEK